MRILIITFLISNFINVEGQNLKLSLMSDNTTFEVGENIELELSVEAIEGELSSLLGDDITVIDITEFKKRIVVIYTSSGRKTIGPYKLSIDSIDLESNQLEIDIVEATIVNEISDTVVSIITPESVKKGQEFSIVIKSNTDLSPSSMNLNEITLDDFSSFVIDKIRIKDNSFLSQLGSSYSSSSEASDGKLTEEHIYTLKVKAKKQGEIIVNHDLFKPELPKGFESKKIEIK